MDTRVERRRPDRHLIALRLMRRIAIVALVASAVLWVGPLALTELGVMGPRPEECIETADRALKVARTYGAASLPVYQKAEHERDRARELVRSGQPREARRAAEQATTLAIEAQKQALVRRSDAQQRAEVVYTDLDKEINDLEKLYSATAPGLEKEQVGQILSLMKVTRQSAGVVFLAYEQKDWNGVLGGEAHAREVIAGTRQALKSVQRP
ncbi:MAG TPA: hypothetical protein VIK51_16805 [Vicinamibacteria bacterium]